MKLRHDFPAFFVIVPAQEHDELIPAGPEYRTVGEEVTDDAAGGADQLVARFVAIGIVGLLQAVQVADRDGKGLRVSGGDPFVQLRFLIGIGMLAFYTGQRIGVCLMPGNAQLCLAFFRAPDHQPVAVDQDDQGQHKNRDYDQNAPGAGGPDEVQLPRH